ncbi:hypothetical protein B0H14DRAFT_2629631 [Mycena olivaceomarginata]|nr:hypothetical protein B0H14DRAFT_2629631 [Mycena olivaceomarginata]
MKYILSALVLSVAITLTGALNVSESASAERRSSQTCGNPADAQPFYRSYNNPSFVDHYYTASVDFLNTASSSYPLQCVAAFVFVTQEESTVPLYRLSSAAATDNFYTISTAERDNALQNGYIVVPRDPMTYIYPTQVCGSVPFYRLFHKTKLDNFLYHL